MKEIRINAYCRITNNGVWINGEEKKIESFGENSQFLDNIYRSLDIQYLKFFKMDRLSKAGFLSTEIVMNTMKIEKDLSKKDYAIICFNRSSSLDDDAVYQKTIQDELNYFPSPSVFVYTLPNIVTGEIAIRHKIYGETSFYITEKFSAKQIFNPITDIFKSGNISALLCGWIECYKDVCDVLMMYISQKNEGEQLNLENLAKIYH